MNNLTASIACVFAILSAPSSTRSDVLVVNDGGFVEYDQGNALVVFGQRPITPVMTSTKRTQYARAKAPTEQVLKAINDAGARYAGDRAIARAGLSGKQWMTLFRSNIEIESAYNPDALSHVGAVGLGQLMPATARDLGVDPHNMQENLDGSARYLLAMLRQFGSGELALAAYNAGPQAVERHAGVPPYKETQGHVRKVMSVYHQILNN
jgi:soluble lytic murein transglycosylase-like protein